MVLRIFLRVIAQNLQCTGPNAANVKTVNLDIGAVALIDASAPVRTCMCIFYVCVIDWVSEDVAGKP